MKKVHANFRRAYRWICTNTKLIWFSRSRKATNYRCVYKYKRILLTQLSAKIFTWKTCALRLRARHYGKQCWHKYLPIPCLYMYFEDISFALFPLWHIHTTGWFRKKNDMVKVLWRGADLIFKGMSYLICVFNSGEDDTKTINRP